MLAVPGGFRNMRSRETMFLKAKNKGYNLINYIEDMVDIAENVVLGENNIIFAQSHLGIHGKMGNNNIIRQNTYLGHDFDMGAVIILFHQAVILAVLIKLAVFVL